MNRVFSSSFANDIDFELYTKPGDYNTWHERSRENIFVNDCSHKAYILRENARDNSGRNAELVHRGYWIKNIKKDTPYKSPIHIQLIVSVSVDLKKRVGGNDWWSPLTVGLRHISTWDVVFTLALGPEGYLSLMHVPTHGKQDSKYTKRKILFPQNQYVKLDVYCDLTPKTGYVNLYQDKVLIDQAELWNGIGSCSLVHGGLYASAAVDKCITFNGFFLMAEVKDEEDSKKYIDSDVAMQDLPTRSRYLHHDGVKH